MKAGFDKIAALCGILSPIVAFIAVYLAISNYPGFSFSGNWLSDLGVNELSARFFNLGIVAAGILAAIFSLSLIKSRKFAFMLLLGSVSLIGVGLFTSGAGAAHSAFAAFFFVFMVLSLLAAAIAERAPYTYLFVFLAAVAITAWLPFIAEGKGALRESISASALAVFFIVTGFRRLVAGRKN